jgi:hypothetical protein
MENCHIGRHQLRGRLGTKVRFVFALVVKIEPTLRVFSNQMDTCKWPVSKRSTASFSNIGAGIYTLRLARMLFGNLAP